MAKVRQAIAVIPYTLAVMALKGLNIVSLLIADLYAIPTGLDRALVKKRAEASYSDQNLNVRSHRQPERKSAILAYNIDANRRKDGHDNAATKKGEEGPSPATVWR